MTDFVSAMADERWRTILVSVEPPDQLQRDAAELDIPSATLRTRRRRGYGAAVARLVQLVRLWRVDVVNSHLLDPSLLATVIRRAGLIRGLVVTQHEPPEFLDVADIPRWKRAILRQAVRLTHTSADAVVAHSERACRELAARGNLPGKIHHIPLGLDITRFDDVTPAEILSIRRELGLEGRTLTAASVGRLSWEKRHDVLIRAWKGVVERHPTARLVIVGAGPRRSELAALAAQLGLADAVLLAGQRDDVHRILRSVDMMVHVSRTESSAMVHNEALATGIPLVSTPTGIIGDVLRDGEHCVVVAHGDVGGTHAAIIRLADDAALRSRITRDGRRLVNDAFSIGTMARSYRALYARVLDRA